MWRREEWQCRRRLNRLSEIYFQWKSEHPRWRWVIDRSSCWNLHNSCGISSEVNLSYRARYFQFVDANRVWISSSMEYKSRLERKVWKNEEIMGRRYGIDLAWFWQIYCRRERVSDGGTIEISLGVFTMLNEWGNSRAHIERDATMGKVLNSVDEEVFSHT